MLAETRTAVAARTRMWMACGVVAGPLYVTVSLAQALTRDGFDLARHPWSFLSNGNLGWLQISNFVLAGALTVALAIGLHQAWPRPGWAPRLVATFGVSLMLAGALRADPALGFPVGTPPGPAPVSWHGTLHFLLGAVGFTALIAACLVVARRFATAGRPGWAWYSRITGVLFLAAFVGIASGGGNAATTIAFTVAVVVAWAWLSAIALYQYQQTR